MASIDPSAALIYALQCPADSSEQTQALKGLRVLLESDLEALKTLCPTLLQTAVSMRDTVFKRWTIDLFHFSISSNRLSLEIRTQLALQCADTCASILATSTTTQILKRIIQCYAQLYPLLFRYLCINRANRQPWDVLSIAKGRIVEFLESSPPAPVGVRLAALKFAQRVILVQTRGVSDPRLQNKADPNVSLIPSDHLFINATALEAEGTQLLTLVTTILYSSSDSDSVSAVINSFGTLAKARPQLLQFIIEATSKWSPAKLAGQSTLRIRSAEKSIFILLNYLLKSGVGQAFTMDIARALEQISERIKQIIRAEHARRTAAAEAERERMKRAASTPLASSDPKRAKLEPSDPDTSSAVSALANFNFQDLSAELVTDLIVANLQHFSVHDINTAIDNLRTLKAESSRTATATPEPSTQEAPQKPDLDDEEMEYEPEKLNRELDSAEASQAAETIDDSAEADELALQLQSTTFDLPPPQELDIAQAESFIRSAMVRISKTGTKQLERVHMNLIAVPHDADSAPMPELGANNDELLKPIPSHEMWILLFVRTVTRGQRSSVSTLATGDPGTHGQDAKEEQDTTVGKTEPALSAGGRNDGLRQMICNYIMEDFASRTRIATIWLNEEWYNEDVRGGEKSERSTYEFWLLHLLELYIPHIEATDRVLTKFLLDLPHLPQRVLQYLADLATDPSTAAPSFNTLRDLALLKPPMRSNALNILLQLTTHPDTKTRIVAINTVKKWVPDVKPLDKLVQKFAIRLLRRLETRTKSKANGVIVQSTPQESDTGREVPPSSPLEDGEERPDPELDMSVTTPYLPGTLTTPAESAQVLQHVQLLFALSVKVPDLLDEIFLAYNKMEDSVQGAVQDLLTPLIRLLGSSHGKLLTVLRTFSPGAESLALRVLRILTEHGRPSPPLVALVKSLISERDLDARFLIPIIGELDRAEIEKQLPRIVNLLTGKPEERDMVRSVFLTIVEPPSQGFGTASTNEPRERESELLKPVELLMFLHETDKGVNTRSAIEGIDICFGLTELFPSEVFAVGMQQIVDKPTLPVLFMRTVIIAVKTYKSLVPFVARTLMSRLILKKIWTVPQLWDGFMRCARIIAPASYGALQQLPREQLAEVAEKHPVLRSGLRDHIIKKAGGTKSKILDVLGGDESSTPGTGSMPANVAPAQLASPSA
ncbi:Symplekin tight junction protein C terminal-domain-containing protein [Cantharellus anzutake]|uniref:Symplekin tight junction protein C terminal-domain-containing protein n=1 Tax=Cantharellus anzutake TaxID=1750568 RepID=UPI00190805B1|nr:Symplekin tight junction protein C terminal-domain-containing protein [Cantharellus anzutake]KAF8329522.1 Symplekin tight junction protein C terminal-domain-containing protein [Cantharellus anzutake]